MWPFIAEPRGQPIWVPKNNRNSSISSMLTSPLFNAAYVCDSIGIGDPAAPTQARVTQRRSRGVSTPRRHISPNTNPITPASM